MTFPLNPPKTLLVGIDAACWDYLDPLVQAGRLPNISSLLDGGSHGFLESVMPPITPAAWSSLVTGVNPGKHNVFEWFRRDKDSYQFFPVDSSQRIGSPVWKRLNDSGIRVGVVNIPLTHPVRPIEGFMLCGFSTPLSSRSLTYPYSVLDELESKFGTYFPDINKGSPDELRGSIYTQEREHQAQQVRIACWLAKRYDVQVLIMNLMLLDHTNHTQKDMVMVEQAICDTDSDLGVLLEEFTPDNVLLISDHGSRRVKGVFLLQAWLAENDYISLQERSFPDRSPVLNFLLRQKESSSNQEIDGLGRMKIRLQREAMLYLPDFLMKSRYDQLEKDIPLSQLQIFFRNEFVASKSSAYLPATLRGNININLSGREPEGIVPEAEKDDLIEKLRVELLEVRDPDTGERIFRALYRPEEIYSGPFCTNAPDLTGDYYACHWSMRSNLPGLYPRTTRYFVTSERWHGDHSLNGIYIFSGRDFKQEPLRNHAHIVDIPSTLLYLYDLPIPEDYDGEPLVETIREAIVNKLKLRRQPGDDRGLSKTNSELSSKEQEEIMRRLHDLGYVE